jgi:hypothetical protein
MGKAGRFIVEVLIGSIIEAVSILITCAILAQLSRCFGC